MQRPTPTPDKPRYVNVDRLRILAMLAIVLYHCPGCADRSLVLKFGVATFLLITCTFRSRQPFGLCTGRNLPQELPNVSPVLKVGKIVFCGEFFQFSNPHISVIVPAKSHSCCARGSFRRVHAVTERLNIDRADKVIIHGIVCVSG